MKRSKIDASLVMHEASSGDGMRRRVLSRMAVMSGMLAAPAWVHAQTGDEFGTHVLRAAGSTFVHPLMDAWAREYRSFRHGGAAAVAAVGGGLDDEVGGVALDYEAVGSLAGIQRLRTRAVDLAASEMPMPQRELRLQKLVQVPLVAGAVALVHTVGAASTLRLDGPALADIFLGRIKRWNDDRLRALNPGVSLPDASIAVIHRADGSGTTFTFTDYLSGISATWKEQIGSDLLVKWPTGVGKPGNRAVAQAVRDTPNAIAYVSLTQARQAKLPTATLMNVAGAFVAPDMEGVESALKHSAWTRGEASDSSLNHGQGAATYPIIAAVYGMASTTADRRSLRAREFLAWSLRHGGTTARELGYVPLPTDIAKRAMALVS
jgi:phosphate transport system substrate-binding protein